MKSARQRYLSRTTINNLEMVAPYTICNSIERITKAELTSKSSEALVSRPLQSARQSVLSKFRHQDQDMFIEPSDYFVDLEYVDISNTANITFAPSLTKFVNFLDLNTHKMFGRLITDIDDEKFKRMLKGCIDDKGEPRFNWSRIVNRLSRMPKEHSRNEETRLAYRINNTYFVKCLFTFGIRTVGEGRRHLLKAGTRGMAVLLPHYGQNFDRNPGTVRLYDLYRFRQFELSPGVVYEFPEHTSYLLMTFKKCIFCMNDVPTNLQLDFQTFSAEEPITEETTALTTQDSQVYGEEYVLNVPYAIDTPGTSVIPYPISEQVQSEPEIDTNSHNAHTSNVNCNLQEENEMTSEQRIIQQFLDEFNSICEESGMMDMETQNG